MNTDSQWSKQEACFAHVAQVWLAVNQNTSVTSGKWNRCLKCIAWATELGSCHSYLCLSWGYERLQKSIDSLMACFENVNTLIKSSNRSVLKINFLEKYIFLTNQIYSTKFKDNLILIFHVYSINDMFSYRIEPVGANFIYKPWILPALKNASDPLELSISVYQWFYCCFWDTAFAFWILE